MCFKEALDKTLQLGPQEKSYQEAYQQLEEAAQSIAEWIRQADGTNDLDVRVEPGFHSNLGQQLNIVLRIPDLLVRDTLFRAYVPPAGQVNLDFFGEQPVPSGIPDLQGHILEFLGRPEVKSRMNLYRQLIHG